MSEMCNAVRTYNAVCRVVRTYNECVHSILQQALQPFSSSTLVNVLEALVDQFLKRLDLLLNNNNVLGHLRLARSNVALICQHCWPRAARGTLCQADCLNNEVDAIEQY